MNNARIRISKYVGFEASGSAISNSSVDSGYAPHLVRELERVGTRGGTITVDAECLRDLAEWCDAVEISASQGGNPSGARALRDLAERARTQAQALEES